MSLTVASMKHFEKVMSLLGLNLTENGITVKEDFKLELNYVLS